MVYRFQRAKSGDLFIKGPSSAIMYWNNREKLRNFPRCVDEKVAINICVIRKVITLTLVEMMRCRKSAVSDVSPFEVEGTLVEHPAVLESAVIGVSDQSVLLKRKLLWF
jgi:benzoate-CoA ligase